jgi:FkbM family methyltransferase
MLKRAGKFYFRLQGYYPVRINGSHYKGDPYHIGFWRSLNRGEFEKEFFDLLDIHLKPGSTYCDIGSWIGPTVLYAARHCRQVHCFEPDPLAYPYLLQNLGLNRIQNVIANPVAIAPRDGTVKMASHGGNLGDSMTSMVNVGKGRESIVAPSMRWDSWLQKEKPGRIDFIKMDIEGGEVEVIPDMLAYLKAEKPVLHLSVHGRYLDKETRMEKLEEMFSTLGFYRECLDEQMRQVAGTEGLAAASFESFRSFLFIP